jgi:integrase
VGHTKDLWTRPEEQPDGKITRIPNARYGKGKRWLACWLDPDSNERTKAFKNKALADNHWRDMESDRDRGDYRDPKAGRELFADIAQRWLSSRTVDPSSRIRYESVYRLHVEPVFGCKRVRTIKPSDVSTFQTELGERFGPSTVATARLILVGVLNLAVADDLVKKNPALATVVQKVTAGDGQRIVAWSEKRVAALTDAHPDSLRLLPIIGSTCGLREGELFGLAEEDIDFDEGLLRVRRQLKKLGKHHVFGLPKNDRERVVPLSSWTAQNIRVHLAKYPSEPLTMPWEKPDGKPRSHNVLFRWLDGGHMKPRAYSETVWKPALVAAGIIPPPEKDARGRRHYVTTRREGTHQLRHHYASIMLAGNVNIRELSEYLGHADPGFTLRIYAHLLPDSHDRARKVIDDRMFRPRAVADSSQS